MWSVPSSNVSYVAREEPLYPKRVPSVFTGNNENRTQPMEVDADGPVTVDVKKVSCQHKDKETNFLRVINWGEYSSLFKQIREWC